MTTARLLRDGLLEGAIVLAAPRTAITDACAALGARVEALEADRLEQEAVRAAAGAHAEALRAGLESMARTLSIEWSRHGVRTAALLPGPETTDGELGQLVAFLASPAGEYYSGCALALR